MSLGRGMSNGLSGSAVLVELSTLICCVELAVFFQYHVFFFYYMKRMCMYGLQLYPC